MAKDNEKWVDFRKIRSFLPIVNCSNYSIYIYPASFLYFEFDQLMPEVAMVSLVIVLNGLNNKSVGIRHNIICLVN